MNHAVIDRGLLVSAQAETWIGVPFHWQGRVRAGCDCKGLIAGIAEELGFAEARSLAALTGDYDYKVPHRRLRAGLVELFDRVTLADRRAGDLLLCRLSGVAQHLAIDCPQPGRADRVIEAQVDAQAVRPFRRGAGCIDSIWRWRD